MEHEINLSVKVHKYFPHLPFVIEIEKRKKVIRFESDKSRTTEALEIPNGRNEGTATDGHLTNVYKSVIPNSRCGGITAPKS